MNITLPSYSTMNKVCICELILIDCELLSETVIENDYYMSIVLLTLVFLCRDFSF